MKHLFVITSGVKAGLEGEEYEKCVRECGLRATDGFVAAMCPEKCKNVSTKPRFPGLPTA